MTPTRAAVFMARRQLLRDPLARGAAMLGDRWPATLESLGVASAASEVVLVGPVACVLRGYAGEIPEARVGLIGRWRHQGAVLQQLMGAGAMQVGFDSAPQGFASRERWHAASGASVSVGWLLADRDHEIDELRAISDDLEVPGAGTLRLPPVSALRDRAAASRWPADRELATGLDAVLAAGRSPSPVARPADWVVLDTGAARIDRTVRPELAEITIPCSGPLPAQVRRAAAANVKELVLAEGHPRALRAAGLDASGDHAVITAAAPRELLASWIDSGDLLAAVTTAVDDAYRSNARPTRT